jgi:uncharacterized damage-inducible protein DinB
MDHFPLMARFNTWVNERIYDSVAQLSDDEYELGRGAFFGSIHNTLNHLLVVDQGISSLDEILYKDFASLRVARRREDERLTELVDGLSEKQLQRPVSYRRIIGDGMEEARVDHILLTLFNHQTHHRGQVHTMLTQAGITPPPLDVIYFLDEVGQAGRPGTVGEAPE